MLKSVRIINLLYAVNSNAQLIGQIAPYDEVGSCVKESSLGIAVKIINHRLF